MTRRLISILALVLLPEVAAAAGPAYVWVHPAKTDLYAMTLIFDARHRNVDYEKLIGVRTGRMPTPVDVAALAAVLDVLRKAEARGPAGCDTLVAIKGQVPIWAFTLIDTTAAGTTVVRSTSRASLESIRCRAREALAALGPMGPQSVKYALTTLSTAGPHLVPKENLAALTGSRLYFQRMQERDDLIADARALRSDRNWDRVAFDLWTARVPSGRGVRLSTGTMRGLADDPMLPSPIKVGAGTLKAVIEHFMGRPSIEIASHFPREEAMRDGASGYVAAIEIAANAAGPEPVFAADLLPADADALAREVAGFLNFRDPIAAAAIRRELALGAKPKAAPIPALATSGPVPLAIWLAPTTGEDFTSGMLFADVGTSGKPYRFTGNRRIRPDRELFWRGNQYTATAGPRERALVAALLDQAAQGEGTPCDPRLQYAQWPPNWKVRIYDTATDTTAHVAREFTVSMRAVRCRALAAYDALGRKGDPAARSMLEQLSELGVDHFAPEHGKPVPPQRKAPDDARSSLLALAHDPAGTPRTSKLLVSLWSLSDRRRPHEVEFARLAAPGVRPASTRPQDEDILTVDEATLRALLITALSEPSVAIGSRRSRAAFVPDAAHAEFRVLERHDGLPNPEPVFIAYLTRQEGAALAQKLVRTAHERGSSATPTLERVLRVLRDSP